MSNIMESNRILTLLGIGWILGCLTSLVFFIRFGVNALWALSVLGIAFLTLGFFHQVNQSQNTKKSSKETSKEKKTLVNHIRVWKE